MNNITTALRALWIGIALAASAAAPAFAQSKSGATAQQRAEAHFRAVRAKPPELWVPGLVPPEGLRFHIRESIERGHATRIGHGVSIMQEDDAVGLLKRMARDKIMVEICLTSDTGILGVSGTQHPLATYLKYGVPTALASDDEGVSRSEMTHEYVKAAQEQNISYRQLKTMARNSLQYAFVEGAALWKDVERVQPVAQCAGSRPGVSKTNARCEKYLGQSPKATLQWRLEHAITKFERKF